ncbi:MAG: hypothetical protein R3A46_21240 [Thermomicrobiales bacterium]
MTEPPPLEGYQVIGRIIRLQIQRQTLKHPLEPKPGHDRSPEQFYDPQHILASEELWVADTVAAIQLGDDYVIDVHAAAHPRSRNRGNGNMLSIGFTSHYDKMRDRFDDHLTDGIAGENILVEASGILDVEDFAAGLAIQTAHGELVECNEVTIAAPCVEFSRFCLGDRYADPRATSDALRFLGNGTRGFYGYISSGLPAMIRTGDTLLVGP